MATFKISPALADEIAELVATDWNAGDRVIKIYGSATSQAAADALIPATAGAAIGSATLLCTISNNSAGTKITLNTTPTSGVVTKASAETWSGVNAASGYAAFYRAQDISDTGALSTTDKRVQGTVGTIGKDLIIGNAYMTGGNTQRIDSYSLGEPTE